MGCQRAQVCSLTMFHVSHPYLVSLYATFKKFADFYTTHVSMNGGKSLKKVSVVVMYACVPSFIAVSNYEVKT